MTRNPLIPRLSSHASDAEGGGEVELLFSYYLTSWSESHALPERLK